jgi:peptidyl-prolyl cis-trans isomerase A (cyclophilin A)
MKTNSPFFIILFIALLVHQSFSQKVQIQTPLGNIDVELYAKKAPITVANFLKYVDEKRYDGSSFYRVVRMDNQQTSPIKIEVIQGGLRTDSLKMLPTIAQETTQKTGLRHLDGTISMARGKPESASSEFFICINNQPELDFGGKRNPDGQGFAAFGMVTKGMDIVKKIQQGTTSVPAPNGLAQTLDSPILIKTVVRLK